MSAHPTNDPLIAPEGDGTTDRAPTNLRDWFAGQALLGLLVANEAHPNFDDDRGFEVAAYEIADRMLAARRAGPS